MTHDDESHEFLAEAIFDRVRALPLAAGMRGIHAMSWSDIRSIAPMEAERYRQAADAAFRHLGRRLPPLRRKALRAALVDRTRLRSRHRAGSRPRVRPDG